jgi:aminopeptidase N
MGTDLYFERHDGEAVTTEDFVRAMEDANDTDLSQFRYWYSQAGTPVLDIAASYDEAAQTYQLNVKQSCPATPGQPDKQPFHMPIALGLLDSDGNDIEFTCAPEDVAHIDSNEGYTAVLHLREGEQQFTFGNVTTRPIPSLLRGFSAPVKLSFDMSRSDLTFLMQHDSDGFNRWEAGQRLAVAVIQEVIGQIQAGKEIQVDHKIIAAFESLLNDVVAADDIDRAMVAEMMVLPGEGYLAELAEVADVDAIHQAREAVRLEIAKKLKGLLVSVYKLCQSDVAYQPDSDGVAQRALKNVCLAYLMADDSGEYVDLCLSQFEKSDNMTDTAAAVRGLINCPAEVAAGARDKVLAEFYNRWQDEALVVDMWFSMQANSVQPGTLEKVKTLMSHEAFTLKNPNRVRSLVSAFCMNNTVHFHAGDGSGYQFLADRVIELNAINPQLAARLLSPLTRWGKYDESRQALMRAELQRILAEGDLSPDVYEIASKSA